MIIGFPNYHLSSQKQGRKAVMGRKAEMNILCGGELDIFSEEGKNDQVYGGRPRAS